MKLSFDQWTLLIGGAIILCLMFLNVHKENINVCEEYFEEPCHSYSISDKICSCEMEDYELTQDMIDERNQMTEKLNEQFRNWQLVGIYNLTVEEI